MGFFKNHKVATALVALGVTTYIAGMVFFSLRTYPNTTVNGEARGLRSIGTLLDKQPAGHPVTFKGLYDERLSLSAGDLNLRYKLTKAPEIDQKLPLWFVEVFLPHAYEAKYEVDYDHQKLDFAVLSAPFDPNGSLPQDAKIKIEGEQAVIVPEVAGKRIITDKLKQGIIDGLMSGNEEVVLDDIYIEPKITVAKDGERLKQEQARLNELMKVKVTLELENRSYELSGEAVIGIIGSDGKTPDKEKISDWVANIARETDTYGTSRRFDATGIGEITVHPGIYGWQINVAETTDALYELILKGGVQQLKPSYNHEGYARGDKNDIGNTYIEVDLSRQHLWAYQDGELLIDSGIVSGMGNTKFDTAVGVNKIWSRETDQILRGNSFDSGVPYASPVKYWMPINWNGVGLHDASWRDRFGGSIYLGNGSNGCINLPEETAKTLFENYSVGTPVVVYESSTDYSDPERF